MSKVTIMTKLSLFCLLFIAATFKVNAQSKHPLVPDTYVFSSDSLSGFDETTAKQAAFAANAYGDEYKVFMYMAKREYIKAKYSLPTIAPQLPASANKGAAITVANCVNEDFEQGSLSSAVPGTLTIGSTTGVAGWTVTSGSNSGATGSCLLSGSYTGAPNACQVISTSTASAAGAVDPIIGSSYPIYSVFGNNVNGGSAVAGNPPNMMGDWFIRINNSTAGASIHKLSKTFAVTPANALFQFAFIAVIQGAHCCCDNAGFALKVYKQTGCTGVPTLTTCPSFTASPPAGAGCTPTGTCGAGGATTYLNAATSGWYYNKWKVSTMDLSTYIGDCITIEIYAIDCPYSGHAGYVYFDAQCNPMAIIGNSTSFPAGTPQITLPTCGTGNTATITAPPGMGPYVWSGPDPLVNGSTAQTVTTSITGNYTITMTPPGSCGPSVKQVSVVISPAPNLALSPQQVTCTNTLNSLSLLMSSGTAGTTTPQYTVSFSPSLPTNTVGVSATTGTYTGFAPGNYTCTITDAAGCQATQTFSMAAAVPVPSFTLNPLATVVGCAPNNTTAITAVNTSTLSNMTYTWSSTSTGTFVGNPWIGGAPTGTNVITVTGSDITVGSCPVTQTIQITGNTAVPGISVSPLTKTLTCGSPCASFTATCPSGTTNIVGVWLDQSNAVLTGPSGSPLVLCVSNTGTYTAVFTNSVNGCTSSQSVTVVDNSGLVPTMTVTSNQNTFTLTCGNPQISMNINTTSTITPKTYSWTNVTTSVTTTPVTGGYTVTVPGQYIACLNANNCVVCQTITIAQDTVKPIVSSITSLPSSSYTLTCKNPVLTASAVTSPMLPLTSYSWTTPPNLTVSQPTISVSLSNITSSTTPTSYTVLAMGANGCVGRQKVLISKDIFVPPYTAVFTPSAITCAVPCVALSTGASTSTVPVTFTFTSPAPTMTANTNGYLFCNPGTYTMTYQSTLNGCTATTTTLVPLNVTPPSTVVVPPVQVQCGQATATITAGTSTTSSAFSYTWDPPSLTTALSCPGGAGCYSTTVNQAGQYGVFILNNINGCSATNTITVLPPSLPVGLTANPASGFAPLGVTFANTTPSTSTSGTVTTTWTYGNGTSVTTTSAASTYTGSSTPFPGGSTTYNSAGTYTVWLVMAQNSGTTSCAGTASTVINVDLASQMTVPNVFTPNQDGVNDFFSLRTTNLTEIKCTIFDRWGVMMYDVTSETGNIAWDGKNLGGKEVPEGTYFYIITAKGKDGKTEFLNEKGEKIPEKGYVSLYR